MLRLYTRRSLKAKLAFWSIAAIAGVVLSVTSFALYVIRAHLTHSAAEMQSSFVEGVARTLDARLADRRRALAQVAQVLGPLEISRRADVQAHFDARPLVYNLFDAVFIAAPDGTVIFDARARGARVASSVADRSYFQEALTTDRTVVSAPLTGKASAEPAIVFATRLRDASGRTTGVLGGILYLAGGNFLSELAQLRIGSTGHVSLIAKGDTPVFVSHPDPALILAPLPSPAQWPHAHQALQGPVTTAEGPGLTGAASLFSYRDLTEVPWVLQGVYPTNEAHAELRDTERGVVALGAALMLAAGVLVWRRVAHLLRPLEQLRDAMRRSCNQPQALEVATPDQTRELFEVADAYNALMRHMEEARSALQRSEERLRLITDNLPAQILYIDAEQRYRFVNGEVGRLLGVDPASLLGRTVSEVRGRRLYSHLQAHLATALSGTSVCFEGEQTDDGRTQWFRTTYVPDADPSGQVRGLFSMTVDITAQKEGELRRIASEERVVRILAHAPDAFIGIDPAGTINEWNRQAEVTFGWTREEVLGQRLADVVIPPAHRNVHERGLSQFLPSGATRDGSNRIEVSALRRDGSEVPVELSMARVREPNGVAAIAFLRDITERRAAEARLAASEQRLRMIADNLPGLVAYVDADQRMQFVNETYRTWLGIDPVAAIGRRVVDVLGPDYYEPRRAYLARALAGERVEFDYDACRTGRPLHLHTVYVPDVRADGQVVGLYALTSDVTARKAEEARLIEQARVDPLTGLPNRRAFEERLGEALARGRRSGRAFALLYLDIDHFKQINDTHGHGVGDEVLKEFARRLLACVRHADTVARLAGDEFVIICEGLAELAEARLVAEKIGLAMRPPLQVGDEVRRITASVGVAWVPDAEASPEDLLARADRALYRAKRAGRNTFAVAED